MRFDTITISVVSAFLCFNAGCTHIANISNLGGISGKTTGYTAARVKITPLTDFAKAQKKDEAVKLKIYVDLLDRYDCRVKSPAVFRFELHEYTPRSADIKGKRISLWPDIDLTSIEANNNRWCDFMRCYEFELDIKSTLQPNAAYVLELTCMFPDHRSVSSELPITYNK